MSDKITCSESPCFTCPYRRDVPSGIWSEEEYAKLPPYDRPTWEQPPGLFMCHQNTGGLCTGWLQSHANREHQYDLLALRMAWPKLDREVSRVALMKPLVKLFRTGLAAARHGMKAIARPGKKAKQAMAILLKKRVVDSFETERLADTVARILAEGEIEAAAAMARRT